MKTTLQTQWNGQPSDHSFAYNLLIDDQRLIFEVDFSACAQGLPHSISGQYTPELWKWDVAELFLSNDQGKYLELNLAPSGAYWIQGFLTTRSTDPEFQPNEYLTHHVDTKIHLSIPALESYLGNLSLWRVNVTGILNSPQQTFLSLNILPGTQADFHQPHHFLTTLK